MFKCECLSFAAGLLLIASTSLCRAQEPTQPSEGQSGDLELWRTSMVQTPLPSRNGCFHASYPRTEWQGVLCTTAPLVPYRHARGPRSATVGNGTDYAAQASSGSISSAVGSFPSVSGVTSVTDPPPGASPFSLQLNTNTFSTSACAGAANPQACSGWQQFVFSDSGIVFMQYWLLGWGSTTCPNNWTFYNNSGDLECYRNSSMVAAPVQTAAGLAGLILTGQANGGQDAVTLYTPITGNIWAVGQDSVLNLEQGWNTAEFNIFGDGNGTQAVFNPGSTITVKTSIANGTTNAPICVSNGNGFTGETNSLTLLPPCSSSGGALPAIQFTESNVVPALNTLYSFCAQPGCADGESPNAAPIQGTSGSLYGTTVGGGADGEGTVFKITTSGALTTLHTFGSESADGGNPVGALIQATDGNFYGTTYGGGASSNCSGGCGTIFKITTSGVLTTLYSFCSQSSCTDGVNPYAGLIQATDGNLYGTTYGGGAAGKGTIFKITRSGKLTTLHSFCTNSACREGSYPYAGLIQATDGKLYGTTLGGPNSNGTVFSITTSGTLTPLYAFCSQSGCADGGGPYGGLIQATDGNLYGTTNRRRSR
jgi:uncharacterized repeat protein (TIGR03803 family)